MVEKSKTDENLHGLILDKELFLLGEIALKKQSIGTGIIEAAFFLGEDLTGIKKMVKMFSRIRKRR